MILSSKSSSEDIGKRLVVLYASIIIIVFFALLFYFVKSFLVSVEKKLDAHMVNYTSLTKSVETLVQKIGSVGYQIATDYDTTEWVQYDDNNNIDYYMLYTIQRRFISIINSDQAISSIYLFNKKTQKIFSSNFMISNLEAFPVKDIFKDFLQKKKKTAFYHSTIERQTELGINKIIPYISAVPLNNTEGGVLVVNINEKNFFSSLNYEAGGLILIDDDNNILAYRNQEVLQVFENSKSDIIKDEGNSNNIVTKGSVKWNGQKYYYFVSNDSKQGMKLIQVIPYNEILKEIDFDYRKVLYTAILTVLFLTVSVMVFPFFKKIYSKPLVRYSQNLKDNIEDLRETLVSNILTGKITSKEEIVQKTREFGINLLDQEYLIIVFQFNDFYKELVNPQNEKRSSMSKSILKAIKYMLMLDYSPFVVKTDLNKAAVLITFRRGKNPEKIMTELKKTIRYVQTEILENFNLTVCAVVTNISNKTDELPDLYAQAIKGLEYRAIYGKDSIIECSSMEIMEKEKYNYPFKEINRIIECMRKGDIKEIEKSMDKISDHIIHNHLYSLEMLNAVYANILYSIVKYVQEFGTSINDVSQEDIFITLYRHEIIQDKKDHILKVCNQVLDFKKTRESNMDKALTEKILHFINSRYDKNISLNLLAEEVHMNPSYLSSFIKKHLGFNFIDYVNDLRIEKSLEHLKKGKMTVKEIANVCGYDNVHTYIRNFKKNYDVTPSVFRNANLENRNV